jgi:AcrR family transcriptional regulator
MASKGAPADEPGDFRTRVRDLLRTSILDAARRLATEREWAEVRIADIAAEVGVSRQTIYNEYGAKDALGAAIFSREVDDFRERLMTAVAEAPDFASAVRRAIELALEVGGSHPVVRRMLDSASNGDSSLLPLLTTRADLLVVPLRRALAEALQQRFPGTVPERAELLTDLTIRSTLSQVVLPSDLPEERVVDMIVAMTVGAARNGSPAG